MHKSLNQRIATVFQIHTNFGQTLEKFNELLKQNLKKKSFFMKKFLFLDEISDLISNKNEALGSLL